MRIDRTQVLSLGLVLCAFALGAAFYPRLPELVPTHWGLRGTADGFTPKPWGPFVIPLTMLATWLILLAVPRISPRGFGVESFRRAYAVIQVAVLAFLLLLSALATLAGAGFPVDVGRAAIGGTGLLFVVLGNFMGKLTRNFFVGIRTPWTLASEEVWHRTHRLAGKLFVLAGIATFASGLAGGGAVPLVAAAAVASLVPALFSYLLYRRLEGFSGGRQQPGDRPRDP